jgi:hypothetical protein
MKDTRKLSTTFQDRISGTTQNELGNVTKQGPNDKVGYKAPEVSTTRRKK